MVEFPLLARGKGLRDVRAFRVRMVNRPGAIAEVASILQEAGVNVLNGAHSAEPGEDEGEWVFFADLSEVRMDLVDLLGKLRSTPGVVEVDVGGMRAGGIVINDLSPGFTVLGMPASVMRWEWFYRLLESVRSQWGAAGEAFLYHMGYGAGNAVQPFWEEKTGLRGRDLVEAALSIIRAMNWIRSFELVEYDEGDERATVRITGSLECEMGKIRGARGPYSQYIRGVLAGFIGGVFGEPTIAEETKCIVSGDEYDEIRVRAIKLA